LNDRTCVVSRIAGDPGEMVRFVRSPEGAVVPDIGHGLPGRGVWIGSRRTLVGEAVKRRLFARGLGADVRAPQDLADQVEALLERAALGLLSLCNKAGLVVQGFEKVRQCIDRGEAVALIEARDGSRDGARKLRNRLTAADLKIPVVENFESARLDLALGRSNVIHAALVEAAGNGLPGKFLDAARRLEAYRADPAGRG